jgi:uncharacterized membrane protein YeaQ/YmgE (transglycosylase-associated protein family)
VDTLGWIVVGLGAGALVSRLMLYTGDRRIPGAVLGMVGAFLGATGVRLLAPGAAGDAVTSLVAALAGAIGLTFAVSVVTSGRGRTRAAEAARDAQPEERADMLTYDETRDALVEQLLADATAHDAKRYDEVGRRFDALERKFPRGPAPELAKLRIALTFWDGWIDARNLGWQSSGGIRKAEWPGLARGVASDLAEDREISDLTVRGRFDGAGRSLDGRAQTLAARLAAR